MGNRNVLFCNICEKTKDSSELRGFLFREHEQSSFNPFMVFVEADHPEAKTHGCLTCLRNIQDLERVPLP